MDIPYLIQALQNKIIILNNAQAQAYAIGDLNTVNSLNQELLSTQNTLSQLNLLATISATAAAMNTTATDVIASGIDAAQDASTSSSTVIVDGYDISTYATDPMYAEKLQTILNVVPTFVVPADIDAYIQGVAPGSPITGAMVMAAAAQYDVDVRLLTAILQLESQFGTQGVGAATFNPGNVGNTGTATQTYASWADGIAAVADWLSFHNVSNVVAATQTTNSATSTATSTPSTATSTNPVIPISVTTSTTTVMPVTTTTTTTTAPEASSTSITIGTSTVSVPSPTPTSTPADASSTTSTDSATSTTDSASSTVSISTSTTNATPSSTDPAPVAPIIVVTSSTSTPPASLDIPIPTPQDPSASSTATSTGQ